MSLKSLPFLEHLTAEPDEPLDLLVLPLGSRHADVQFDGDQGYGLGINFFITGRLSAEITASEVKPESRVQFADGTAVGELDMLPITGVIQYHFKPDGKFDPYIGAGVAYLIFDEFSSKDPNLDVSDVDIRNDYGAVLNVGFSYEFGYGFAVIGDAKYVPSSNEITTNIGDAKVDLNPLILSAGLMIRF